MAPTEGKVAKSEQRRMSPRYPRR